MFWKYFEFNDKKNFAKNISIKLKFSKLESIILFKLSFFSIVKLLFFNLIYLINNKYEENIKKKNINKLKILK